MFLPGTAQLEAIVRGGMTDAKRREIEALKKLEDPRTGDNAMRAPKTKPSLSGATMRLPILIAGIVLILVGVV